MLASTTILGVLQPTPGARRHGRPQVAAAADGYRYNCFADLVRIDPACAARTALLAGVTDNMGRRIPLGMGGPAHIQAYTGTRAKGRLGHARVRRSFAELNPPGMAPRHVYPRSSARREDVRSGPDGTGFPKEDKALAKKKTINCRISIRRDHAKQRSVEVGMPGSQTPRYRIRAPAL